MGYLSQDDYTISISVTNLTEILSVASASSGLTAAQVRANAENLAIAEINSYLSQYFATSNEFGKSAGDATRNMLILRIVVNIALWQIHQSINPRDVPEIRQELYDKALKDLVSFREGNLLCGLTRLPTSQTGGGRRIELYSNQKFISKPYDDPQFLNPETVLTP